MTWTDAPGAGGVALHVGVPDLLAGVAGELLVLVGVQTGVTGVGLEQTQRLAGLCEIGPGDFRGSSSLRNRRPTRPSLSDLARVVGACREEVLSDRHFPCHSGGPVPACSVREE